MDELSIIDGYIQDGQFVMRSLAGHAVDGKYNADGLNSLARLIHNDEPFSFMINKDKTIMVPVELNLQLKNEFFKISKAL